jgi:hypothetical protein
MITVDSGSDNTVTLAKLTTGTTAGVGVFDVLMRSVKAQLDAEYQASRIKGSEYATVYLGSLQAVLQTSLQMVLAQEKTNLEIAVLEKEILLRDQQITRTNKEIEILEQKRLTELAQTNDTGVDADSVIGRQKALYAAQTLGFAQDAKHKVAQLLVSTWNIRRTTSESEPADFINRLEDRSIGAAIQEACTSVGITLPTEAIP